MATLRLKRFVAATMALIASSAAEAQIDGIRQFSDNVPGRQYHFCEQGDQNSELQMWKAFSTEGKPLGYGLRATPSEAAFIRFEQGQTEKPPIRVTLMWPEQFSIVRSIDPGFDRENASLSVMVMPRAEILPDWKKGIFTQYIVDRGKGLYIWPNGSVINAGLPVASPSIMTEPNQDRSFTFHAGLPDFLAWGKDRDRLTIHKVAVARGERERGTITPAFGERRLLYSISVDMAALATTADEVVRKFESWERGLDFKACPIVVEEDESSIIVTDGAGG
jgi:hypothetical protein